MHQESKLLIWLRLSARLVNRDKDLIATTDMHRWPVWVYAQRPGKGLQAKPKIYSIKKKKIESHFTYNNMRRVWGGMKLLSRYVNGNTQKIASVNTAGEVNELNQFFNRFDCNDFSQKHRQIHDILNRSSAEENDFQRLNTYEDEVQRAFQHVNPNKATGPDNIAP